MSCGSGLMTRRIAKSGMADRLLAADFSEVRWDGMGCGVVWWDVVWWDVVWWDVVGRGDMWWGGSMLSW